MSYEAPPSDPPLSPEVAATIARAELRREKLEHLSNLAMRLADDLVERATQAPRATTAGGEPPPEPRHEPGRAFAAVSRAVRLTLTLEAKIDQEILALIRGEAAEAEARDESAPSPPPPPNPFIRRRRRITACLWDAINEKATDAENADDLCAAVQERLVEGETYDEFLFRPFRESVEAVCRDLGLQPDWSRWDDEVGFPPETRRTDRDFTKIWDTWPIGAKLRRSHRAATAPVQAVVRRE